MALVMETNKEITQYKRDNKPHIHLSPLNKVRPLITTTPNGFQATGIIVSNSSPMSLVN